MKFNALAEQSHCMVCHYVIIRVRYAAEALTPKHFSCDIVVTFMMYVVRYHLYAQIVLYLGENTNVAAVVYDDLIECNK